MMGLEEEWDLVWKVLSQLLPKGEAPRRKLATGGSQHHRNDSCDIEFCQCLSDAPRHRLPSGTKPVWWGQHILELSQDPLLRWNGHSSLGH